MFNLYSILVSAAAISAVPAVRRDVATVLDNLEAINDQAVSLTSTVQSWDGSLLGALGIYSDVTAAVDTVNDATAEAETEPQASSADSTTILNYVSGTLKPDLVAALDALTAREADVSAFGLNSLLVSNLEDFQDDTDALGVALINIASTDVQPSAQAVITEVDAAFESAIAVFS